jgi:rhomboid protease GluP
MGFIALLVLLGAAWYFTTPKERDRFRRALLGGAGQAMSGASRYWPARQAFDDALDARTARPLVTLAIVALNVGIFMAMVMGSGSLSDPNTIVRWGGSIGTRTANGEWWRLATAMFVNAGFLQVVANTAGLVQIGLITERFFGRFALASAFTGAGVLFAVLGLLLHPVAVTAGGSAGVFAVYGLFVAMLVTGVMSPSPFTVPLTTLLKIAPAAALFLLYGVAAGHATALELSGLAVGLVYGFVLAKPARVEIPSLPRTVSLTAAIAAVVITAGIPMRGVIDVRPEISRIAEIEEQTASAYDSAVHRFTAGELTLKELVAVIDRTILPQLRAAQDRLKRLQHVPREQAPLVTRADEYFKLREESWQARAAGLRRTSLKGLRSPDDTERQARETLESLITDH